MITNNPSLNIIIVDADWILYDSIKPQKTVDWQRKLFTIDTKTCTPATRVVSSSRYQSFRFLETQSNSKFTFTRTAAATFP